MPSLLAHDSKQKQMSFRWCAPAISRYEWRNHPEIGVVRKEWVVQIEWGEGSAAAIRLVQHTAYCTTRGGREEGKGKIIIGAIAMAEEQYHRINNRRGAETRVVCVAVSGETARSKWRGGKYKHMVEGRKEEGKRGEPVYGRWCPSWSGRGKQPQKGGAPRTWIIQKARVSGDQSMDGGWSLVSQWIPSQQQISADFPWCDYSTLVVSLTKRQWNQGKEGRLVFWLSDGLSLYASSSSRFRIHFRRV